MSKEIEELREALAIFMAENAVDLKVLRAARKYLKVLEARENGAKLVDGWQDIDTAPKDGFVIGKGGPSAYPVDVYSVQGFTTNSTPAHWQPLPDEATDLLNEIEGE